MTFRSPRALILSQCVPHSILHHPLGPWGHLPWGVLPASAQGLGHPLRAALPSGRGREITQANSLSTLMTFIPHGPQSQEQEGLALSRASPGSGLAS